MLERERRKQSAHATDALDLPFSLQRQRNCLPVSDSGGGFDVFNGKAPDGHR